MITSHPHPSPRHCGLRSAIGQQRCLRHCGRRPAISSSRHCGLRPAISPSSASAVWDTFYKENSRTNLIKGKDTVVVAVSGGADSMCLLHLLIRLSKKINLNLIVVSFNHGLRKQSQKETEMVKAFGTKFGIQTILQKLQTKKYATQNNLSLETAGRDLRYKSLIEIAKKFKCKKIATAHNANDNAETVLMNLLRGSASASGIPQRRKADSGIEIIRPLLCIKRKFIDAYVAKNQLPFCIDETNLDEKFTRNKIRHSLIPECEKINPLAIDHILNFAQIQKKQDEFLEKIVSKLIKKSVLTKKNKIFIDLECLMKYNPAITQRIIRKILPVNVNSFQINLIMQKISLLDHLPHILSANWMFQVKSKKAVFWTV